MKRIGYHYLPDTTHYRQSDLDAWLPQLQALGAEWLVLMAPVHRAIPERFIKSLQEAGIEPVLHFHLYPDKPPTRDDLDLLFKTYARWDVRYIVLFDRPNTRAAWRSTAWAQKDLVERFLDSYLPLAEASLKAGLTPVFPPLEPGGDFWDLTFLRTALKSIQRRGYLKLLDRMVIGAYARINNHNLNWGAGGPERWPGVKPYHKAVEWQDHRGFRIFDWYLAITEAILLESRPVFLLGMGNLPGKNGDIHPDTQSQTSKHLNVARLLAGETIKGLDPIPSEVLGGAFWVLTAPPNSPYEHQAWFYGNTKTKPIVNAIKKWVRKGKKDLPTPQGKVEPDAPPTQEDGPEIHHYLLLPNYDWGISNIRPEAIRPFLQKHKPTIGFSLKEATRAKRVTVIGGPQIIPEVALNKLRAKGCIVDRIDGDGIDIASKISSKSHNLGTGEE
jgi:hypothetical protein